MGSGLPLAEHSKKTQLRIPHVPEDKFVNINKYVTILNNICAITFNDFENYLLTS